MRESTPCEERLRHRKKLRVLCAEDEPILRAVLKLGIERAGHHCELAVDGREAYGRLRDKDSPFDLLVTDNEMPRLSGLQLVKELREAGFTGRVIVFSSLLRPTEDRDFRQLDVSEILTKPASLSDLVAAIARVEKEPAALSDQSSRCST